MSQTSRISPNDRRIGERNKMQGFRPRPREDKPKPWSHQQELVKGKQVQIWTNQGVFAGDILEADQFTIKLKLVGDVRGERIIFKSAITAFGIC